METVEYGSGPLNSLNSFTIPASATQIEITPYMWSGHYGEWDGENFTVWKLINPSTWRVITGVQAPPHLCLAVGSTVSRWRFRQGLQEFHVEFDQSSQSPTLLPIQKDQLKLSPIDLLILSQTDLLHSLQTQTHPVKMKKDQEETEEMTHLSTPMTHLGPPPTHLSIKLQETVKEAKAMAMVKWRIHTRMI
jgi:hypothetical protein